MKIYTIGSNGKTAEQFFETLRRKNITRLLDIRRNNTSQLSAFTKKNDLEYFLKMILSADYRHLLLLAPDEALLDRYKKDKDWALYEVDYLRGLEKSRVSERLDISLFDRDVVLLCSEPTPEKCHRRLAAEFLSPLLSAEGVQHL